MALFEVTDYDKKVYEEELKDFLPDKMFDIHTHLWCKEFDPPEEEMPVDRAVTRTVLWPSLVADTNPVEDLQETYRLMFPGKEVKALCFTTRKPYDKNNEYVSKATAAVGWAGLYYSDPEESADELEKHIREGGFLGVKCYLSRSKSYLPEAEIRIFDFFPKHQLKRLDEMGAVVMLHIPRHGRLKDPVNLAQIIELRQEFPNVRLVVAHVGRAYVDSDIGNAFEVLSVVPDTQFDFCANCNETAIREVIRHAGVKNVMFGTDMPILRMRCRRIQENGTYINLVPPGLYGDPKQDSHLREVTAEEAKEITFFAYEELLAFKRAAVSLGLSRQDVEDIMYNNAVKLLDDARKSIYGE